MTSGYHPFSFCRKTWIYNVKFCSAGFCSLEISTQCSVGIGWNEPTALQRFLESECAHHFQVINCDGSARTTPTLVSANLHTASPNWRTVNRSRILITFSCDSLSVILISQYLKKKYDSIKLVVLQAVVGVAVRSVQAVRDRKTLLTLA